MSSARSKIIQYMRECAPSLYNIPPTYFLKSKDSKEKLLLDSPDLLRLLGCTVDPVTQTITYDRLPPMLYRDEIQPDENLFLNANLIKVSSLSYPLSIVANIVVLR